MKVSIYKTDVKSGNAVNIEIEYNAEIEADRIESCAKLAQFFAFAMQDGEKSKRKAKAEVEDKNWIGDLMRKMTEILVAEKL